MARSILSIRALLGVLLMNVAHCEMSCILLTRAISFSTGCDWERIPTIWSSISANFMRAQDSESQFGRVEQATVNLSADNQKERMCGEGQCHKIWAWTNNALRTKGQALGIWQVKPATNRCIILQHASPQEFPSKNFMWHLYWLNKALRSTQN